MTGLDLGTDKLIEIAALVTDSDLNILGEGVDLSAFGTPVSGSWGSGTLIRTAVASAIITADGRIAAGAVPEQVLTDALGQ